jgi:glycosyltransferase involved in cell wall biosynthesis
MISHFPKISIITPSFNQGQYLEETILSVIEQNYPNLEYIIIDGGSSDDSVDIIKKYEEHITYWVSEKDEGQAHAINKGIEKCTGEVFAWINSDDFYEKGALHQVAEAFKQNTEADFVCGFSNIFEDESKKLIEQYRMRIYDNLPEKTICKNRMNQQATFWKTAVFNDIGVLNESFNYAFDLEFWLRYVSKQGTERVVKIDKLLAWFRHHGSSKTISALPSFWAEEDIIFKYLTLKFENNKKRQAFYFPYMNEIKYLDLQWSYNALDEGKMRKGLLLRTYVTIKFRRKYIRIRTYIKHFFKQNLFSVLRDSLKMLSYFYLSKPKKNKL